MEVLLSALKELGGYADKHEIYNFLWINDSSGRRMRPGFERKGRAWALDRIQHDLYGLCQAGRVILVRPGFVYYLSEKELWA